MKMKKLDMSGVKNYLFQKGERVGLGVCAVIAVLLVGVGLMKAGGSNVPYADHFKKIREPLDRQISSTKEVATPADDNLPQVAQTWSPKDVDFPWTPIMTQADPSDNVRRNPVILKVLDDPKHIQADVLIGGYFAHELDLKGETVWALGERDRSASPAPRRARLPGSIT